MYFILYLKHICAVIFIFSISPPFECSFCIFFLSAVFFFHFYTKCYNLQNYVDFHKTGMSVVLVLTHLISLSLLAIPVLSDGFCGDSIRKFSSAISSHISDKRQRFKEHRKSVGSSSPSPDPDGTFPSRLRRHGDPEKPKGKRQCKTKHLGQQERRMLLQSTNEECPELSPAHQHKVSCTCRRNDRRSRCSFIRARTSFLCLCARPTVLFALARNPSVLPRLSEEPFKNVSPITTMLIIPIREASRLSGTAQRMREGVIACVFRVRLL